MTLVDGIDISDAEFIELVNAFIESEEGLVGVMVCFVVLCSFY